MEKTVFPYDPKWEHTDFAPPNKRILQFHDVTEYQQRPIHDEYLHFLADLQKVCLTTVSPSSQKKYQKQLRMRSSTFSRGCSGS